MCSLRRFAPRLPTLIFRNVILGGAFWLKSELFLTKIRTANFDAPPRRRSLTLATPQKSFLHIFYFARPRFFLLKGKENFFAGLCSERAGRRGFASARARRNSPHTPLPPRPRLGWRNFLRRAYLSSRVFCRFLNPIAHFVVSIIIVPQIKIITLGNLPTSFGSVALQILYLAYINPQ